MTDGYPSRDAGRITFIELFERLEMSRLVLSDKPLYLTTLFVLMIVATILNLAVNYAEDHLMRWRQGLEANPRLFSHILFLGPLGKPPGAKIWPRNPAEGWGDTQPQAKGLMNELLQFGWIVSSNPFVPASLEGVDFGKSFFHK
jgi:hypothetical protein